MPAAWIETATARQTSNGSNPNSDWDQGYGYQFWRCRHGCYRGDGAFGQYCIVMPEQDAVIAITSGTRDMQGVMNLVWDKLLPAMQPKRLRADKESRKKLEQTLAGLTLKPQQGTGSPAAAAKWSGKTFTFPANNQKLETVALEFGNAGSPVTLVTRCNGVEQRARLRQRRVDQGTDDLRSLAGTTRGRQRRVDGRRHLHRATELLRNPLPADLESEVHRRPVTLRLRIQRQLRPDQTTPTRRQAPITHAMKIHRAMSALLSAAALTAIAQENPLGQFEANGDIGNPTLAGSASYDAANQEYTLTAAGTNMWFGRDQFHFVWKKMKGDFILRTRVEFLGPGVDPHRKVGWMVRPNLDADAPYADCAEHGGDGLTSLQFRRTKGGNTDQVRLAITNANVLQFERKGNTYIFSAARYGETFVTGQVTNLDLGDEVYVGLYLCSHKGDVVEKAKFRDVRIIRPVKEGFTPYRDYIGSVLEILDVHTGKLEAIYSSKQPFEAPNWTHGRKSFDLQHQRPRRGLGPTGPLRSCHANADAH